MGQSQNFIPMAFVLVCIFGILVLYILNSILKIKRLKKSGHMVYGKIVDISKIGFPDGPMYSAIIEYVTLDGQTICFKSKEGGPTMPVIGEAVAVLYEPGKPDEAIEFKTSAVNKSTIILIFFALIILIILIGIISKAS